jgi:hypothetical protein
MLCQLGRELSHIPAGEFDLYGTEVPIFGIASISNTHHGPHSIFEHREDDFLAYLIPILGEIGGPLGKLSGDAVLLPFHTEGHQRPSQII